MSITHSYGLVRRSPRDPTRLAVRAGDEVFDLAGVDGVPAAVAGADSLDPLLALGHSGWDDVHGAVADHLTTGPQGTPVDELQVALPIRPGDYVDFYASEHHAANLGRILRPGTEPLLPNWRHLPVGYHGRAGSLVVSGTPVRRPNGLLGPGVFGPSRRLDLELELGFVVGTDVPMGAIVTPEEADHHVFGVALVNDWSARDIQAFEYQPLGPFAGKSFATSVAGWITPLAAVPRAASPLQNPPPVSTLAAPVQGALDLDLEWWIDGTRIGHANAHHLYWTFGQMLAHLTSNGGGLRRGDLFASGTISGPGAGQAGSLIEAARNGAQPVTLDDGTTRAWLDDGDTVTLTGEWFGGRLAEVTGTVLSAREVR